MLVLTRKTGEEIFIGENLVLVVMEVGRNKIKLGFKGDDSIVIKRGELIRPPESPLLAARWAEKAAERAEAERARHAPLREFMNGGE